MGVSFIVYETSPLSYAEMKQMGPQMRAEIGQAHDCIILLGRLHTTSERWEQGPTHLSHSGLCYDIEPPRVICPMQPKWAELGWPKPYPRFPFLSHLQLLTCTLKVPTSSIKNWERPLPSCLQHVKFSVNKMLGGPRDSAACFCGIHFACESQNLVIRLVRHNFECIFLFFS